MKSRLFREDPSPGKSFLDNLNVLVELDIKDEILKIIPKSISKYALATNSESMDEAIKDFRSKWPLPLQKLISVLDIGEYFLRNMSLEDSTDDIMADLKDMSIIKSEKLPKLSLFIDMLQKEFQETFAADRMALNAEMAVLKRISAISYATELRAVIPGPEDLTIENMDKYKPTVNCLVPIAILHLRLTGDEKVIFQMNHKTLKVLQNALRTLEKDLEQTVAFVGKDKVKLLFEEESK